MLYYFRSQGIAHTTIEDIYDDTTLHGELAEAKDNLEHDQIDQEAYIKGLKIKKA